MWKPTNYEIFILSWRFKIKPVELGQRRARSSNRMSRSMFIVRVWILKIWVRDSRSGNPNSTLRSNRPGRKRAGSNVSGLHILKPKSDSESCHSINFWISFPQSVRTSIFSVLHLSGIKLHTRHISKRKVWTHLKNLLVEVQGTTGIYLYSKSKQDTPLLWLEGLRKVPVCCHQYFDVSSGIKAIKLVDNFKHSSLDFIITSQTIIKSSTSNSIYLIKKYNAGLLWASHLLTNMGNMSSEWQIVTTLQNINDCKVLPWNLHR